MKHFHKRLAATVAIAATASLLFTACASGSDSTKTTTSSLKGQSISYWLWDTNQQPAYTECAADFTKKALLEQALLGDGKAAGLKGTQLEQVGIDPGNLRFERIVA